MADFTPITEIRAFLESGTTATARTNIGLGNVDNTTDLLKPVSTATLVVTDAITARDWVEVADDTYTGNQSPSVYTSGRAYVMNVVVAADYPSSAGTLTTDYRGSRPFQRFNDTVNAFCWVRGARASLTSWNGWEKTIASDAGVISDALTFSGQQQATGQSFVDGDSIITGDLGDVRYNPKIQVAVPVTQASDLSGTLDSTKVYTLDGFVAMGSQTITVPAGGLTIVGVGRRISGLSSSEAGYSMFVDAAGDAGTLNMCCFDITCDGAGSQIFDLDNSEAGGFVTSIDMSYTNAANLGEFTDYAAALFENNTVFNATEGFTFSGTWSAGIRVNLFIGLAGANGLIYFGEGTSLTFGSRFISNANLSVPTAGVGYNFSASNFLNDGQFELIGGDFSGAGTPVTGTTRGNTRSKWRDNNGLANTYIGARWNLTTETATTIPGSDTYVLLAGTTTYVDEQWFSNTTDNTFVYDSTNTIEVMIQGTMSLSAGNNNQIQVKIRQWDASASAYIDIHEHGPITMSGTGVGENKAILGYAELEIGDRIELWVQNLSASTNITMLEGTLVSVSERAN